MSVNVTSQPGNNGIKPDVPTGQSAVATAGGGATVSFTPSTNPGKGSANYVATSTPGSFTASAASSPITFSSATLTANTSYTFTIVKQSGSGVSSDASSATSPITAFYVPSAPTSVSAAATGTSKQITVSWTAPSANGSAITGYYIDYSTSSTFASGVTTTTSASTSKTITDAGWVNGTVVYFRVRAENAAGQSANSGTASDYPYAPPTLTVTQAVSSATTPTSSGTTTVSSVSTTTATLGVTGLNKATLIDYERVSGSGGTSPGNGSLTGLPQKTAHSWRARVQNTESSFQVSATVTPNGSTTFMYLEYGPTTSYGTTTQSYNMGSTSAGGLSFGANDYPTAATLYYRVTATYRGGAVVQATGSIARATSTFNATSVSFNTYGTYTYTSGGVGATLLVIKPANGVDITSISGAVLGGGGGGTTNSGYGAGGGGGGQYKSFSGITSNNNISMSRGAGGGANGYGGSTSFVYSSGNVTAAGGTPAVGVQGGASPLDGGNYNYGYVGNISYGGGGGGAGGAATDANGGPSYFGAGPGGPGFYNLAPYGGTGNGLWGSGGSSTSDGAGGNGASSSAGPGNHGGWTITYTGPHRDGGSVGDA